MYKFVEDIDKEKYNSFYKKVHGSFMQSYEWGEFNRVGRNQIPHYVGLTKNGEIVCEALLLEKKGMFNLSYFYSPRGFLIDFFDEKLVEEFVKCLKEYVKKYNAIYLKVDPEIEYQEIDSKALAIPNGYNNYDLYEHLLSMGFIHTGFTKHFENNQPRYTFVIDLSQDFDIISKNIHKSVMKKVKKTFEYDMVFRKSDNVDTFYDLLLKTSEKDNFLPYTREYYQNAYRILDGVYQLFELVINPMTLYKSRQEKLESLESDKNNSYEETKNRLLKELNELEPYKEFEELVICSQMCACTDDTMWTLYIGNDEIGKNFYAVNRMYYEIIQYAKKTNHEKLDLFGTVGDPDTTYKNLAGIHKYKQNYGGKYIELIGEFDYVNKKFAYKVLPLVLKIYRKMLRFKRKRVANTNSK